MLHLELVWDTFYSIKRDELLLLTNTTLDGFVRTVGL